MAGKWDASTWPRQVAGEIPNFNPRELVEDRKLHKLIRRTDLFGLYAASKAIEGAGIVARRDALDAAAAAEYNDRTGVYVGSGGGSYEVPQEDSREDLANRPGGEPSRIIPPCCLRFPGRVPPKPGTIPR